MELITSYYIFSNFVCIIILGILFIRTIRGVDQQLSQVFFSRTILFYILYCMIDIIWCFFEAGYIVNNNLFFVFYAANYIVSSFCAFYWFIYSESIQGNKDILQKKTRVHYALPLIIVLFIGIVFLAFIEYLYREKFQVPFYLYYYLITTLTPVFYVVAAFTKSIKRFREKKNTENRSIHFIMGLYPVILFVSTVIQIFFLIDYPFICYVIVIGLLCVYFKSMDNLISIDALTKLNNRNQLYSYVEKCRKDGKSEKWVFFIDADKFKNINDTYGHLEGDNALVLISSALKKSCKGYPSRFFIARYGGDEFLILANKHDLDDCYELKDKINKELKKAAKENKLQYNLSVSVGFSLADFNKTTIEECLKTADEKLYKEKKEKKQKTLN